MALKERQAALRKLQEVRGSKVLVHFLSDRRIAQGIPITGMNTQLAGESYPFVHEHLRTLGHHEKVDFFLYTSGGHLDSVWAFVRLFRSFGKRFSVLVPMRALSAGTLLCLGADEIVMGEAAQLSPIDPTTANAFNPREKDNKPMPISVEDVTSYLDLARGDEKGGETRGGAGLKSDEHILEVFKGLIGQVHPLALGNVKRVYSQIRVIARKLLELHLSGEDSEERIGRVVSTLTEELFSHTHLICRAEAVDILGEDVVVLPSPEEEAAMWELYEQYAEFFELKHTFNLKDWLGQDQEKELEAVGGAIESEEMSHLFKAMSKIRQLPELPQGMQMQIAPGQRVPLVPGLPTRVAIEPIREGWYTNEEGV